MNRTQRPIEPVRGLLLGRLLVAAALLLGLLGMHGLTMSVNGPGRGLSASRAATVMHMPEAGTAPVAVAGGVSMVSADVGMPMPGGHGSHDMLHACLAVLGGLVALALLFAAWAQTVHARISLVALRWRRRGLAYRFKPLPLSATQLCISRT